MIERTKKFKDPITLRGMLARGHFRLVLLAVFLATLSLMISGVVALKGYADKNVELAAETLSYTIEPALVFGDAAAAQRIVDRLGRTNNLALIEVRDARGREFVRWQRPDQGSDLAEAVGSSWLGLGPVKRQIVFRGQVMGEVLTTGSVSAIYHYAFAAIVIALCCLGVTVIATRMLARRLEERVVVPFDRLVEIAHDLISQRRLSHRLEPQGIAEIDKFASYFNVLLKELESWNETLVNENAELLRRVDRDPLTGLGNRVWFERALKDSIAKAKLESGRFVVLICDCNGFKAIIDAHGQAAGDAIICRVADRLQLAAHEADRVFRLSGEEFAMVLQTNSATQVMERVKERVQSVMRTPVTVGLTVEHTLQVRIGHAVYPADGRTPRQLVEVADQRMYSEMRGDFAE